MTQPNEIGVAGTAAGDAALADEAVRPNPHELHLADAQRVLSLFAEGLSGHYMHLKPTDALTGNFRPDGVTTDGTAVYLPPSVALFDSLRHNLGVYRIAVLHQLGFHENGTFEFSFDELRRRQPDLPMDEMRPYDRPLDLERFFSLWQAPTLMRRVFMMIEDLRIDLALVRRYPGARADLDRVQTHELGKRAHVGDLRPFAGLLEGLVQYSLGAARAGLEVAEQTGRLGDMLDALAPVESMGASVYDSAWAAVQCYSVLDEVGLPRRSTRISGDADAEMFEGMGEADVARDKHMGALDEDALGASPVEFRGEIQPDMVQRHLRSDNMVSLLDEMNLLDDSDLTAEELDRLLEQQGLKDAAPAAPDGKPAFEEGNSQEVAQAGRSDQAGMLANLQAGEIAPNEIDPDLLEKAKARRDQLRRQLEMDRSLLRYTFGKTPDGVRSYLYDEWDFHKQVYIKGWCRLFEHRLEGDDFDFIQRVHEKHGLLTQQVKRQFRYLKPESYKRVRRVSDGDELDLDGIIEAVIDRRAGHATDEHVYVRREKASREVAAAFLLDMSASTDDPIPDPDAPPPEPVDPDKEDDFMWGSWAKGRPPEPPKRRVIDVAKESLALMCEALETLGDGYAIYGFSGYGHDEVEFYVAKEFQDRLSARTWAAMGAMKPRRSTRMGPAIRHALAKIERQEVRMKVLIVVSDGFPQDYDYGPDRTDHEYGIQDTAPALQEAERAGVQTFCVTIDRSGNDYLRRMCPDNRYLIIDEVAALPKELAKVYRTLTA